MIINGCLTWKYISYVIIFRAAEHKAHILCVSHLKLVWGGCNNVMSYGSITYVMEMMKQ